MNKIKLHLLSQFDVRDCFILFVAAEKSVEIVRVQEFVRAGDQVEELVERIGPLCYRLRLEIAQQNLLWELELSKYARVKSAKYPLVQVAEVVVPPADDGRLHLPASSLHHDGVGHVLPPLLFHNFCCHHVKLKFRSEFVIANVDRFYFCWFAGPLFLCLSVPPRLSKQCNNFQVSLIKSLYHIAIIAGILIFRYKQLPLYCHHF